MTMKSKLRELISDVVSFFLKPFLVFKGKAGKFLHLCAMKAEGVRTGPGVQVYGKVHVMGTRNITLGANGNLYEGVVLETQQKGKITIGDNFVINQGSILCAMEEMRIGHNVLIAEYVSIRDNDHEFKDGVEKEGGFVSSPIVIEDNVWIGRGCCITRGVRIGKGTVIGANSVVTRDIPARVVAVGAPAKPIKELKT